MISKIIITGGLGYIGSHTIVELKNNVDEFVIIDDLSNSNVNIIDRIKNLTKKRIIHINESINNENELKPLFHLHFLVIGSVIFLLAVFQPKLIGNIYFDSVVIGAAFVNQIIISAILKS